jgi:hypothetical protein
LRHFQARAQEQIEPAKDQKLCRGPRRHPFMTEGNETLRLLCCSNVTDLEPPFVAGAVENGYDETTANIKGRTWYVPLKRRF